MKKTYKFSEKTATKHVKESLLKQAPIMFMSIILGLFIAQKNGDFSFGIIQYVLSFILISLAVFIGIFLGIKLGKKALLLNEYKLEGNTLIHLKPSKKTVTINLDNSTTTSKKFGQLVVKNNKQTIRIFMSIDGFMELEKNIEQAIHG